MVAPQKSTNEYTETGVTLEVVPHQFRAWAHLTDAWASQASAIDYFSSNLSSRPKQYSKENQPNDKLSTVCCLCFYYYFRLFLNKTLSRSGFPYKGDRMSWPEKLWIQFRSSDISPAVVGSVTRQSLPWCRISATSYIEDGGDKHDRNNGPASRFILVLFFLSSDATCSKRIW